MSVRHDEISYAKAKDTVINLIANAAIGITESQAARVCAKAAIEDYKQQKTIEHDQAAKRFKQFQIVEFVVGALFLLQVGVLFLFLRGESLPLIITSGSSVLLYVVVAYLDSRAKRQRRDIHFEILAAKKVKLKNDGGGVGVIADFD